MKRIEPEKREEWEAMLDAPIPGMEPTPAMVEAEGQSFMDLMSAVNAQQEAADG